ncbi:acetyl/propionyl/methylcrotonyl-CoA carboxylase subunit alpha (plasmid) [Peteryoungia desertarenae]|uniref:Acetyl/propionyl/methylcrotonyl-CoA carboxylase subunit alpha n=1 Tax=Peteryoungia desertarenae TaxID=1813451 RepID=A0ABX6QU53_9HYPH|nr:acetyl/propionyl/methylcrotonyl-CoA carboxylase subunit alpha [Peteryoungia desertarenae]QLF71922.1 acetyl/propionyl/methylcrotonyl-CoA carboxylase subunit alpha [Peteryoungia desertarenae]
MFRKILIANRGEIACRIIKTARKLGVSTVAVYSDADRHALHVTLADQAVAIGGAAPKDSYLKGDAIIAAALETGAEAIHPGYGFLSENPDFVDAVESAGLAFIGPSAKAIRAMGLKDAAKALMEKAGVPVVPGYHGDNQDGAFLAEQAQVIGYPVLIKAVAGGGGKGMRRVESAAEFGDALRSAKAEAANAFGNDAVLIEKYVAAPRHIEVQVFGDGRDAVHLFERDCSLQRRHQKVIEEAPAPGMTAEMRQAMGEAAVRAARTIGYSGAGTIEFIVDGSDGLKTDRFWFMEMNTRLQVEHPVTEAITGLDLVEWQLRVASGEPLPLRQEEIRLTGHAFEARLYAEDVEAGFLPATGRLAHLAFPDNCRADTGVRSGDEISPWYDPMIAKIITHGPTRRIALSALGRALRETEVAGTVTNLSFLQALTQHPGFVRGDVDTGLIARDIQALTVKVKDEERDQVMAGLAALQVTGLPRDTLSGFALWAPLEQQVCLEKDGDLLTVSLQFSGPERATVRVGQVSFEALRDQSGWFVEGQARMKLVEAEGIHVFAGSATASFKRQDPLDRDGSAGLGSDVTLAPMPGLVRSILVRVGDDVEPGQTLCVLEAMKMEHSLKAMRTGRVASVFVTEGSQIAAGDPLVQLEPEASHHG